MKRRHQRPIISNPFHGERVINLRSPINWKLDRRSTNETRVMFRTSNAAIWHHVFTIKPSEIVTTGADESSCAVGMGMFAAIDFDKDSKLCFYEGATVAFRDPLSHEWTRCDGDVESAADADIAGMDCTTQSAGSDSLMQVGRVVLDGRQRNFNGTQRINTQRNCKLANLKLTTNGRFVTTRRIAPGTELTVPYGCGWRRAFRAVFHSTQSGDAAK